MFSMMDVENSSGSCITMLICSRRERSEMSRRSRPSSITLPPVVS
jgi:hypothetical protein